MKRLRVTEAINDARLLVSSYVNRLKGAGPPG